MEAFIDKNVWNSVGMIMSEENTEIDENAEKDFWLKFD